MRALLTLFLMLGLLKSELLAGIPASAKASSSKAGLSVSPAVRKKVVALIELTHALDLGKQFGAQILKTLIGDGVKMTPELREKTDAFVSRIMGRLDMAELQEALVEIYVSHFTESDIDGMTAFYGTPLGQKMLASMPALLAESMAAGQKWGKAQATKVLEGEEEAIQEIARLSAESKDGQPETDAGDGGQERQNPSPAPAATR